MVAALHLALLGVPRVSSGGRPLAITVRKTLALAVYLAVEGGASRARLAEMFWGQLGEATARRNLRRALHRLREAGLDDALFADDDHVALRGASTDLQAFESAVQDARWGEAEALQPGRLCEGLDLGDAPAFDDWLALRRERFDRDWRHALQRLAALREGAGDLRAAAALHARLLESDPLQEASHREHMRLLDALGERAAALEACARCERVLREELQLEPLPETRLLADRSRGRGAVAAGPASAPMPAPVAAVFDRQAVPLVARERELAEIAASTAPVLLVEGEAGVGKSRVALEAWRRAAATGDDAPALVLRFSELSTATPFHAVADALRAPARAPLLARLDPAWQRDLARLLPELRPTAATEPAPPAAEEARSRLLEALVQALALAAGPARLLVLDDLQWADASSLELLAHLVRRRAHAPAALPRVVATARPGELAANTAAQVVLDELAREGVLARLSLGAFDDWSMLQLVQRLSRSEGGLRFATRLGAATGGNVFFALETIRALFEAGELRADAHEGWSTRYDDTTTDYAELPLPASVVDAVRARVARLGPAAQRLLETAALAEDGSTLAEIQGATALTEWEALEGIERAIAARVIDRAGAGYRFVHDLFRSALRTALSPERQRLTHAKLAAALEPLHAAPARIAAHWESAGDAGAAALAWARAADAAMALGAVREASTHYTRAASLTADAPAAVALHAKAFTAIRAAGTTGERQTVLAALLASAERSGAPADQFSALTFAAVAALDDRDPPGAERLALRAVREFAPPSVVLHVHALSVVAQAAGLLDRPADALAAHLEAAAVAQVGGNARGEAMMRGSAAVWALQANQPAQAREQRDLALVACQATLGTIHHAQVLSKVTFVDRAEGQRATALARQQQAVDIARRAGQPVYLNIYHANLCETLVDDGQLEAARQALQDLVQGFVDAREAVPRFLAALTAAVVHELAGDLGAAIRSAHDAVAAADLQPDSLATQRESRLLAARLLAAAGADERALASVHSAEALRRPGVDVPLLPAAELRAALALRHDPAAALAAVADLRAALARPFADRMLPPALESARLALAEAALAGGDAATARATVQGLCHSRALEAGALAVRLRAAALEGAPDPAAREAAAATLASGRLPPLQALALQRALGGDRFDAAARQTAQRLADSLRAEPALQSAFIRRHLDLLT